MRRTLALAALALLVARSENAFALEVCINGPSAYGGTIDEAAVQAIVAMKPRCVRLPIRQDVWSGFGDTTPHGPLGLGMLATYDHVIDEYLAEGIEPYVLFTPESIAADPHVVNDPGGRDQFSAAVLAVIDHQKEKVRRFEILNEPNNWDESKMATNPPDAFAATLSAVYSKVKVDHAGDACWNVAIVSGALFAFHQSDGTGNDAAQYLAQVYDAGIASDWPKIQSVTGSYPLDGIGWHLYLENDAPSSTQMSKAATYLDDVWSTITTYEGASTSKRIWISEFGFPTDDSASQNDAQASGLDALYDVFANDDHVAMGMWFTYQDFPNGPWGLYRSSGFSAADARPAKDHFVIRAATDVGPLWAKLAIASAPQSMTAGDTATVTFVAENRGSDTWTASANVRLGAAAGCPDAAASNQILWSVDPGAGYVNSVTDARVYLGPSDAIAHGSFATFTFSVTAPATAGDYVLAARLVDEGVAWFGNTASTVVHVTDASSGTGGSGASGTGGAGATSGAGGGGKGGGSSAGGGAPGSAGNGAKTGAGGTSASGGKAGAGGMSVGSGGDGSAGRSLGGNGGASGGKSGAGGVSVSGAGGSAGASPVVVHDDASQSSGGCGCRASRESGPGAVSIAAVVAALLLRRRRSDDRPAA